MIKILVTGGHGRFASELKKIKTNIKFIYLTKNQLNILNYNSILKIIKKYKPKKTKSNLAITGLYFFDNSVVKFSKALKPSKRKEVEIVDLLKKYKDKKQLNAEIIGRGGAWLDTGSIKDFNDTSNFVATIENRQGFKIGCLEEVAFNNKWIGRKNIKTAISFYGNCEYSKYLDLILNK